MDVKNIKNDLNNYRCKLAMEYGHYFFNGREISKSLYTRISKWIFEGQYITDKLEKINGI